MRHEQVPDDGLERLAVRRHGVRIHGRHDDAGVGDRRRVAAVAADDADDGGADLAWRTAARARDWG